MEIQIKEFTVLIDDDDYDLVIQTAWFPHYRQNTPKPYFRTQRWYGGKKYAMYLHRLIMGNPRGFEIDHISGNVLDNRKSNLRLVTRSQNCMNSVRHKNNSSGYKGVCWHSESKKWRARISVNKKRIHLGHFDTKEEAYGAYCDAAIRLHGEYARFE